MIPYFKLYSVLLITVSFSILPLGDTKVKSRGALHSVLRVLKRSMCYLSRPTHEEEWNNDHDAAEGHPENRIWMPKHIEVTWKHTWNKVKALWCAIIHTLTLIGSKFWLSGVLLGNQTIFSSYQEEWRGLWRRWGSRASVQPPRCRPWQNRNATSSSPGGPRPPRRSLLTRRDELQGDTNRQKCKGYQCQISF